MKVFAIASAKSTLTPDKLQQHMPNEVPATLKLYLEGKVEQAKATLDALPLVADDLMTYELMPVGPLAPLGLLIQNK